MMPKDARVTILTMSGPTALREIPSMKEDMYFGGSTPANPARPLEVRAIEIPKQTMIPMDSTQAMSGGRK